MDHRIILVAAITSVWLGGCPVVPGPPETQGDASVADASAPDTAVFDVHQPDTGADAGLPPPPGDSCVDPVDTNAVGVVDEGGILELSGTNWGASADHETCDPVAPSTRVADVVYRYTPERSGTLQWSLERTTPTLFTVDLRTDCEDRDSMLQCAQCSLGCHHEVEVVGGEPVYLIISGIRTSNSPEGMGEFDLAFNLVPWLLDGETCVPWSDSLRCEPGLVCQDDNGPVCGTPDCGDGIVDYTLLGCDDGNIEDGDGCSSTCALQEQGPGGATCEEAFELQLVAWHYLEDELVLYGIGYGEMVAGSDLDASCASADGPEGVFVLELTETSAVEITATDVDLLTVRQEGAGDCAGEELVCTSEPTTTQSAEFTSLDPGRYVLILDRSAESVHTSAQYLVEVLAY